jgi:hypothetical protein
LASAGCKTNFFQLARFLRNARFYT